MYYNYKVSVKDTVYLSKTRNKACYFCGKKVKRYKPSMCKCKQSNCYLCEKRKPANFPMCKECKKEYIKHQFKRVEIRTTKG